MWIVITFDYVLSRKACASHLNDKKKKEMEENQHFANLRQFRCIPTSKV